MNRISEVLIPAIRQYKHNDGSEGFVMAYDKFETDNAVKQLTDENARLREALTEIVHLVHHPLSLHLTGIIKSTEVKNAIRLLNKDTK